MISKDQLIDRFGRIHDYLRISVTDRCNLRCIYCRPEESASPFDHKEILRYEEIGEIVKVAAKLGVKRIRLTGGEPLVRRDLEKLIKLLSDIPGIEDIALTTNGIFLAEKAAVLKKAGLSRVNISLDSMKPNRYRQMTRGGDIQRVLDAIDASLALGLAPVKLNVVLMRGFNDDEIEDFLFMTLQRPVHVRFIEYMPIASDANEWRTHYLPLISVLERASKFGNPAIMTGNMIGNGPSENYTLPNALGSFGLIHPVSNHFCGTCNRLRLTADGNLKSCLYWGDELYIRPFTHHPEALKQVFLKALSTKPEEHGMNLHSEEQSHTPTWRWMSQIGG
ncbi:GTP 3',8-cyclase MoaA [Brevibacillus ginsengisoli]|uniref:GTP 3',8-cyclase MoaA n=1 Tax=Brevibacillus ginsengisoli TaxID=363854 RepID=UPI003CFA7F51